jgi:ribonuclease G
MPDAEIVINAGARETRIALLEDGQLTELFVERPDSTRMVGAIYKGKVTSVVPAMQAAFVDLGLRQSAFLQISDLAPTPIEEENRQAQSPPERSIADLLKKGQQILVQVTKDPIGRKGPRISAQISLPGRYAVLVPGESKVGVSRRIDDAPERQRLRQMLSEMKPDGVGVIVRTVAEGKDKKHLKGDLRSLVGTWRRIQKQAGKAKAPALLHKEKGITFSIIRDLFTPEVKRLVVDNKKHHRQILSYLRGIRSDLRARVELYRGDQPVFDTFGLERQIEKTLHRRVELRGGGSIVIDQTEALVVIDVNTGRAVARRDAERNIFETNIRAAKETARQLRLRDLGGIIVIDFIDMASESRRERVVQCLRDSLKADRSHTKILPMSEFAVVQLTRERAGPSLLQTFSEPCPICEGTGRVPSEATTAMRIERWLKRAAAEAKLQRVVLTVHPSVLAYLTDEEERVKDWEKEFGLMVKIEHNSDLKPGVFTVFDMDAHADVTSRFAP